MACGIYIANSSTKYRRPNSGTGQATRRYPKLRPHASQEHQARGTGKKTAQGCERFHKWGVLLSGSYMRDPKTLGPD